MDCVEIRYCHKSRVKSSKELVVASIASEPTMIPVKITVQTIKILILAESFSFIIITKFIAQAVNCQNIDRLLRIRLDFFAQI